MHPKMIPVLSSNIDGVAHLSDLTLLVTFKSGKTYAYADVPKDIFTGMTAASSKGTYVNAVIKKGGYTFRPLDDDDVDALLSGEPVIVSTPVAPRARRTVSVANLLLKYPFLQIAF